MLTWIKNNKLLTAGIVLVLIYVIVSAIKKEWNPMNWFSTDTTNLRSGRTGIISGRCYCNGVPQGGNFTSASCAAHCRDQMAS